MAAKSVIIQNLKESIFYKCNEGNELSHAQRISTMRNSIMIILYCVV